MAEGEEGLQVTEISRGRGGEAKVNTTQVKPDTRLKTATRTVRDGQEVIVTQVGDKETVTPVRSR